MKKILMIAWVGLTVVVTSALADTHKAAQQLAAILAKTTTMQAAYVQVITNQQGEITQRGSGTMYLQRPGFFRWETQQPIHQIVVSNGRTISIYDVDLKQVSVSGATNKRAFNPAMILSGTQTEITKYFRVRRVPAAGPMNVDQQFVLQPHLVNNNYKWISFGFQGAVLRILTVVNGLGQRTQYQFTDVHVNQPFPTKVFQLQLAPGVTQVRS